MASAPGLAWAPKKEPKPQSRGRLRGRWLGMIPDQDLDPLGYLAASRFGVDYLYPLQRFVAANVLDAGSYEGGFRQLALLPTGFGKSLCFQLPALLLPRPTVAVYPLLALMEDQRRRLEEVGLASAVFRGGMEEGERRRAEKAVESGEAKLVVTNPESLKGRLLDFLKSQGISHLAIDEAHCVSEWGESFRPSYLELGPVAEALAPPALSAFTATASPRVLESVAKHLFRGSPWSLVQGDPDRPNISYSVARSLSRERALEGLLRREGRPAIVFASSRDGVQILAERLQARLATTELRFYHAGLTREEKTRIESWFMESLTGVLVTTCAYGMGINKKNIRTVIHYESPPSIEAYLQESGRAGRDGRPSRAILLATPLGPRAREDEGEVARARREALEAYASTRGRCRREALLSMLGAELSAPCTGCDVCEGREDLVVEGEAEISAFLAANPRRFDEGEARRLLAGRPGEPPKAGASGSLAHWREEDIRVALGLARGMGIVREAAAWPWKGRLQPGLSKARAREKAAIPPPPAPHRRASWLFPAS